jgi:uncharacterized protein (TIGR00725 family)
MSELASGETYRLCPLTRRLARPGALFDAWALAWEPTDAPLPDGPDLHAVAAVTALHAAAPARALPVGVIGPKAASASETETAARLGRRLGEIGLQVLCGGKNGVMEAVCRGNLEAGGRPIGFVPDEGWRAANPFVAIPLATGIGPARNVLIARASFALVAIGGGYGTLSEMAFGLHFEKPVIALGDAPEVPGAIRCETVEEALGHVCRRFLALGEA